MNTVIHTMALYPAGDHGPEFEDDWYETTGERVWWTSTGFRELTPQGMAKWAENRASHRQFEQGIKYRLAYFAYIGSGRLLIVTIKDNPLNG